MSITDNDCFCLLAVVVTIRGRGKYLLILRNLFPLFCHSTQVNVMEFVIYSSLFHSDMQKCTTGIGQQQSPFSKERNYPRHEYMTKLGQYVGFTVFFWLMSIKSKEERRKDLIFGFTSIHRLINIWKASYQSKLIME